MTTTDHTPAHEYLADELEARGWTIEHFARHSRLDPGQVETILDGSTPITVGIARGIARAFGTSPELWLNLQAAAR